jgi:Flp pilus assembly protein TadD
MTDLARLQAAVSNDPLNAELRYLLGAELAEGGDHEHAIVELATAVKLEPALHTARFQLGLLHLTLARPAECIAAWEPLDTAEGEPCLKLFKHGMEALIRDDFRQCIDLLQRGIALNTTNVPLNRDMAMVVAKAQEALDAHATIQPPVQPATESATQTAAQSAEDASSVRTDFSLYSQTRQ